MQPQDELMTSEMNAHSATRDALTSLPTFDETASGETSTAVSIMPEIEAPKHVDVQPDDLIDVDDLPEDMVPSDLQLDDVALDGPPKLNIQENESVSVTHAVKPAKIKKSTKKRKKDEPPGKPKNPRSGYVHFAMTNRDRFGEENPGLPFHEITRLLGHAWSALSAQEKEPFLDKAAKEKADYLVSLAAWNRETGGYAASSTAQRPIKVPRRHEEDTTRTAARRSWVNMNSESHSITSRVVHQNFDVNPRTNNETYCAACRQYFHSYQEKREHLLEEKHQRMTRGIPNYCIPAQDIALTVPIFSKEFVDHYKIREKKLKDLRKDADAYTARNSTLLDSLDKLKNEESQVGNVVRSAQSEVRQAEQDLLLLRKALVDALQDAPSISNPTERMNPTVDNIDGLIFVLRDFAAKSNQSESFAQIAKLLAA